MQLHQEQADTNMKVTPGTHDNIPPGTPALQMYFLQVILIAGIILAVAEAMPQGYAAVEPTYPDEPPVYTYTYG